jgi:hypothetical protein
VGDKTAGHVKILDVSCYPNLLKAAGHIVECIIEDVGDGDKLYHVHPSLFKVLGCDTGVCRYAYPFYANEVEVIKKE